MPEAVYWGDIIFSLMMILVVIAVLVIVTGAVIKLFSKKQKETGEMNQKLDRIMAHLEKDDDFRK
ncbi:DUF4083 family protein [Salibacterium qingdaonense]|uniref:DUF4083 domain-containing protein n=1 Tax=Salibacterium qingdaonense TaxID=266892 RepID=A0A1I4I3R6_9BACI|nr:DUF4083 family protein [Salibacterium qingdaonense]SFL48593.1 protein of unknown function [Salibacterium qingdaonense]